MRPAGQCIIGEGADSTPDALNSSQGNSFGPQEKREKEYPCERLLEEVLSTFASGAGAGAVRYAGVSGAADCPGGPGTLCDDPGHHWPVSTVL